MVPKVSIVVPMYGVEKFVKECVESICHQTLEDIEIILVDDGSPDRSGEIAEECAKKDNRIKVIHQKNAGLGPARNTGILAATGEYVGFVDSDDWTKPEMYERMYSVAKKDNADIVSSGHCDYTFGVVTRTKKHPLAGKSFSKREEIENIRKNFYGHAIGDTTVEAFPMSAWIAIYKRSYLMENALLFEEILSEDIIFNISAYKYANVVSFTGYLDYCYRKDDQPSIMKTFSEKKMYRYLDFIKRLAELASNEDADCVMRAKRSAIDYTRLYVGIVADSNLSFSKKKMQIARFAENEFIKDTWKGFPIKTLPIQQKIYQLAVMNKQYTAVLLLNDIRQMIKRRFR